jgi:hypothetical protein
MDRIIAKLNESGARYLLIGGQALRLEGMPRFSIDWDLYIPSDDINNIEKINNLLSGILDLELIPLGENGENMVQTYQTDEGILQFHLGGPGLPPFDEAESRMVIHKNDTGTEIRCISGKDLLNTKKASNRPQDQQDIVFLEEKDRLGLLSG